MDNEESQTELNDDEYEPYGDEWRKCVMKLTKSQIVEMLRDECMERRMPVKYQGLK